VGIMRLRFGVTGRILVCGFRMMGEVFCDGIERSAV
jgi:hypothetical protein